MIPRWKIARELDRAGQQVRALVSYPTEPFRRWHHDRTLHKAIRIMEGQAPTTTKYAIFLIFQPRGVSGSTLATARHLMDKGYAVLLVSNSELRADDRNALAPVCWKIVERPNFGYDFGGYRDGIRLLGEMGVKPNALILLNDSIWWPIFSTDTIVDRMESAGADVVGTILHHPRRRGKLRPPRPAFLESYFFWFGPRTLASPAFRAFWDRYRVSSIKYNAVHRGERRLTAALAAGGLAVKGLFSREELSRELRSGGPDAIRQALRFGAVIDPDFQTEAGRLIATFAKDADWVGRAMRYIDACTLRRGFHAAFPHASIVQLGATFLKKSPAQANGSIHHIMREKVLEAMAERALPPITDTVLAEIKKRQSEGAAAVGR